MLLSRLALVSLVLLGLAAHAHAQAVDLTKPPGQVGYEGKLALVATVASDGAVTVKGAAYYPDGTRILVALRHEKQASYFAQQWVTVAARAFTATFGPFDAAVPGGRLATDAWFSLAAQSADTKATLTKDRYFVTDPPGARETKNRAWTLCDNGGAPAQRAAEQAEKAELERARTAIVGARGTFRASLAKVKETGPEAGVKALELLDSDVRDSIEAAATFKLSRAFLLFPRAFVELTGLGNAVREEAALEAARAGLPVTVAADADLDAVARRREALQDTLKGFLAETDSLDKEWARLIEPLRAGRIAEAQRFIALSKELEQKKFWEHDASKKKDAAKKGER